MKFSTIMAAFAITLAVVTSGCRYNKAGADGANGNGNGDNDPNAQDISSDMSGAQDGDLNSLTDGGRFEDMYTKCTDVNFTPVYFGFDSTVVPQGELGKIDAVAAHLDQNADRVVVVEGNCDERGSNEYNMSLGENRAVIIRNYLVQNGIAGDRIQTRSFGEENPAVQGNDESAWSKNRRGEFSIYKK